MTSKTHVWSSTVSRISHDSSQIWSPVILPVILPIKRYNNTPRNEATSDHTARIPPKRLRGGWEMVFYFVYDIWVLLCELVQTGSFGISSYSSCRITLEIASYAISYSQDLNLVHQKVHRGEVYNLLANPKKKVS